MKGSRTFLSAFFLKITFRYTFIRFFWHTLLFFSPFQFSHLSLHHGGINLHGYNSLEIRGATFHSNLPWSYTSSPWTYDYKTAAMFVPRFSIRKHQAGKHSHHFWTAVWWRHGSNIKTKVNPAILKTLTLYVDYFKVVFRSTCQAIPPVKLLAQCTRRSPKEMVAHNLKCLHHCRC